MNQRTAIFLVTWLIAIGYLAFRADRGWIPHDEGTLAHCAERVLHGELPHRDFDELYTGGLSYLHALALKLFGVRLTSLRWMLWIFAAAWVPAVYAIARRAAGPWLSAIATWTAVAWGLPLYFAALPSWYNLFFATFGTWALLRHLDDGRRRWLFAAGVCGGLSIVVKSIGLYYVAAAGLFLFFREQAAAPETPPDGVPRQPFVDSYRVAAAACLAGLCGLVAFLVAKAPGAMSVLHFLLPVVALCGVLSWNEIRRPREPNEIRWRRLLRLAIPFVAGIALPILIFLVPYVSSGSLGDLLYGFFVLPQTRFQFNVLPLPPPSTLVTVLPIVAVFAIPLFLRHAPRHGPRQQLVDRLAAAVLVAGAVLLLAFGGREVVHRGVWTSVRPLIPLAVFAGVVVLALAPRRGRGGVSGRAVAPSPVAVEGQGEGLFLLLAMASMTSLVQIPDAFTLYFGYAAPFAVLALLFVSSAQGVPRRSHAVVLAFYFLFAVFWLHGSLPQAMGTKYWPTALDARLDVERGGLWMPERMATNYRRLVEQIQAHSDPDAFIYAAPDAPEVYFLSARRNPTRSLADFMESDFGDPARRSRRLLAMLEARDVDVVVFKHGSQFSGEVPEILAREVAIRYPRSVEIYPYTILWRPRAPDAGATRRGAPP